MTDRTWDQRIERFYAEEFDDADPQGSIARMEELVAHLPEGDAVALFELGAVHPLALHDDGRSAEALQTALLALVPFLDSYTRALTAYAEELTPTVARSTSERD